MHCKVHVLNCHQTGRGYINTPASSLLGWDNSVVYSTLCSTFLQYHVRYLFEYAPCIDLLPLPVSCAISGSWNHSLHPHPAPPTATHTYTQVLVLGSAAGKPKPKHAPDL